MRRYLVVANQTLGGADLARAVARRMDGGPCSFHIVVPATHPTDHLVWTEGEAKGLAAERLERALAWFASVGAEATGEVGVANPVLAISDAIRERPVDAILLSTLPAGFSRWLRSDLPARVRRRFDVPVEHVIGAPMPAARTA